MQRTRELWNAFRNIAIMFSCLFNFVFMLILLFVVLLIFDIKVGILEPLIDGLHASFVGLDEAVIETQIPVEDTIPIEFDLPLQQEVDVILTEDVRLPSVPAVFSIEGGAGTIRGTVDIRLPANTTLPIRLDMMVPVKQDIDISLLVDVNIPLEDTQLSAPFNELQDLLNPYVRILDNLPDEWGEVRSFTLDALNGDINLLDETNDSRNPWPNFPGPLGEATPQPMPDATATPVPADGGAAPDDEEITPAPTPTITPFPTPTP